MSSIQPMKWTVAFAVVVLALVLSPAQAGDDPPKLGIEGVIVDIGFGKGIGVDSIDEDGFADKMGLRVKSFIWRIEVTHGENKVDRRRTDSFTAVKAALNHKDVSRITLVWRKNGVWYKNSYDVSMRLYGGVEKMDKPDD